MSNTPKTRIWHPLSWKKTQTVQEGRESVWEFSGFSSPGSVSPLLWLSSLYSAAGCVTTFGGRSAKRKVWEVPSGRAWASPTCRTTFQCWPRAFYAGFAFAEMSFFDFSIKLSEILGKSWFLVFLYILYILHQKWDGPLIGLRKFMKKIWKKRKKRFSSKIIPSTPRNPNMTSVNLKEDSDGPKRFGNHFGDFRDFRIRIGPPAPPVKRPATPPPTV